MHLNHGLPPVIFDIVFEFHTIRAIIIYSTKAIIYFARRKNETIFLTMGNQIFKIHIFVLIISCDNNEGAKIRPI
jgi:hypothetical protein